MYSVLTFDEINKLEMPVRSIPLGRYFDEMDLSREQRKERKSLAEEIEDTFLTFLDAAVLALNNDSVVEAVLTLYLVNGLADAFAKRGIPAGLSDYYAPVLAQELVRATFDNVGDKYYLSADRARLVGEEEANTAFNNKDFWVAISRGKTKKRWLTMRDKRVRPTHVELEGVTIPVADFFRVGAAQMLFPRDIMNAPDNPEEIVGCRCSIVYF